MNKFLFSILAAAFVLSSCSKKQSSGKKPDTTTLAPQVTQSEESVREFVASKATLINTFLMTSRNLELPQLDMAGAVVLNENDCKDLQAEITKAYVDVNPFQQQYEHGSISFELCRGASFAIKSGEFKTSLGLEAKQIFQHKIFDIDTITTQSVFLSEKLEILQISESVKTRYGDTEQSMFIQANDADGNYYDKSIVYGLKTENGIVGPYTTVTASSMAGEISLAKEIFHQDKVDTKKWTRLESQTIVTAQNWDAHLLPVTFGWVGGLYKYGEILKDKPADHVAFFRNSDSQDESCSTATISKSGAYFVSYPKDDKERFGCINRNFK